MQRLRCMLELQLGRLGRLRNWRRDGLQHADGPWLCRQHRRRQRGQGMIEYAFLLMLVSEICIVGLHWVETGAFNAFMEVNNGLQCGKTTSCNSGSGPAAYVQSASNITAYNGTNYDSSTLATTFSSSVTAGDLLVAVVRVGSGDTPEVSDNLNGNWTEVTSGSGIPNSYSSIWYFINSKGGTVTVTLTDATKADEERIAMAEYSDVASNASLDSGACYDNSSPGSSVADGSTASIASGDLVFTGGGSSANPLTFSAGTSNGVSAVLRTQTTGGAGTIVAEDVTNSAGGVQDPTLNLVSGSWNGNGFNGCVAAFNPA
jgi:Flp pilus assembly pilin Flp